MIEVLVSTVALFAMILLLTLYFSTAQNKVNRAVREELQPEKQAPETLILLEDCYLEKGKYYNLFSKDGGKSWRVIELHPEKPRILGPVERIHPAVLEDRQAWQRLKSYVASNGSIRLSDRRGTKLLRQAGFDVRKRNH